jgi:DNA segregation ATPase FtsK/SpoIIIE, S-DNA-T family
MAVSATKRGEAPSGRGREILGIVLIALGLLFLAALFSRHFGDGNLMGPLGRGIARLLTTAWGHGSYLVALCMLVLPVRLLAKRPLVRDLGEGIGFALTLLAGTVLLHLGLGAGAGGVLGEHLGEVMRALVSTAGSVLIGVTALAVALVATTGIRFSKLGSIGGGWLARRAGEAWAFLVDVFRAILPEKDELAFDDEDDDRPDTEQPVKRAAPPKKPRKAEATVIEPAAPVAPLAADDTAKVLAEPMPNPDLDPVVILPKKKRPKVIPISEATPIPAEPHVVAEESAPATAMIADGTPQPVIVEAAFQKVAKKEMKEKEKAAAESRPDFIPLGDGIYRLPPVSVLKYDDAGIALDKDAMLELSARLVKTLNDYGVKGEVQAIRPGPVVTMYEFAPAPGTRVSKIANLSDDLAMALEAMRVRIVAPIPGKAAVGIEVPNKQRETVYMKEIIADDTFQKAKSRLTIALGKDIEGRPVSVDLSKMPHLLVAGTTGSGKSVSVNAMIMSLLFNATPEEVRLIMVDPKMLELSIYEGIPHLLLPVVTDPKKANLALRWAVEEMERRYESLAEAGVRDIASYNKKIENLPAPAPALEEAEDSVGGAQRSGALPKKLPYIVVVIDEFADLMMCAPKEVETSVARIAQKARAAGIHLLLATQRPSVDVITGLIKANFPSRIAFQVTSKIDSRTILDQGGAEALLGQGDMLFSDRGGALRRVHGCLVQDEEIAAVVDMLKKQGKPVYDLDILKPREEDAEGGEEGGEDFADDMYDKAVALVAETRQASISMIQRRLRIGYNRAARMIERMEREGIVGPGDGPNRREVLVSAAG